MHKLAGESVCNSLPHPEQGVLLAEAEISLEKNVQLSAIHDRP